MLRDPDIPVAGNPDGDITIVEWFDYNCPYCRKLEPELRQVVQDDGKVRLVLKDWPILGPVSKVAARMALAARYQNKFLVAHEAMMAVNSRITEPRVSELLGRRPRRGSPQQGSQRQREGDRRGARAQQRAGGSLQFNGTPSFIVGKYRVPGVLTMNQFEQAIADARKANMGRKIEKN